MSEMFYLCLATRDYSRCFRVRFKVVHKSFSSLYLPFHILYENNIYLAAIFERNVSFLSTIYVSEDKKRDLQNIV